MKFEDQHIIDFIEGTLDDTNHKRVAELIKSDVEWRSAYLEYQLIDEALKHEQEVSLKKQFAEWGDHSTAIKTIVPKKNRKFNPILVGIAATIIGVLVVFSSVFNRANQADELFAKYYTEPIPNVSRSTESLELSRDYKKALERYTAQEYEASIIEFRKMATDDNRYEESRLLMFDALIKEDNYIAAEKFANQLIDDQQFSETMRQQAEWNLYLLYFKQKKEAETETIRKRIQSDRSHLYHQRIRQFRSEI